MKRVLISIVFAFGILMAELASVQQYPTKPIRIIAPFSPGGGTDVIARYAGIGKATAFLAGVPGGATVGQEFVKKVPHDMRVVVLSILLAKRVSAKGA